MKRTVVVGFFPYSGGQCRGCALGCALGWFGWLDRTVFDEEVEVLGSLGSLKIRYFEGWEKIEKDHLLILLVGVS